MNKYESILNNQFDVYIYHSCLQKRQSTFQDACWQHFSNNVTVGVRLDNISVWLSKEKIQINESTSSQSVKDIIPRFLRFRVPENSCFETTVVHNFQEKLLGQ